MSKIIKSKPKPKFIPEHLNKLNQTISSGTYAGRTVWWVITYASNSFESMMDKGLILPSNAIKSYFYMHQYLTK